MDDFGKGYSSLSYLRRYPFEILKIDKEFVLNLENAPNNRKLIKSIIALCKELGLTVVAEGVETEAQLDFLKKHQCDIVQGFHFSPAVSAQEASKMLLKQTASENTNS